MAVNDSIMMEMSGRYDVESAAAVARAPKPPSRVRGTPYQNDRGFIGPIQRTGIGNYGSVKPQSTKQPSRSMLGKAYGRASKISKATLGTTPGKLALGAGLAVGALGVLDAAIGRDPFADAGALAGGVQRFGRAMEQASRPSYGASAFQQSTQGLTFGLHNARTAY
jgi:hypothetical protein